MSKNLWFSDVFRGYRNGTLGWKRLIPKAGIHKSQLWKGHINAIKAFNVTKKDTRAVSPEFLQCTHKSLDTLNTLVCYFTVSFIYAALYTNQLNQRFNSLWILIQNTNIRSTKKARNLNSVCASIKQTFQTEISCS